MFKKLVSIIAMAVPFFLCASAQGHGVWTETRRGAVELVYGHGPLEDLYDPEKLIKAKAYDAVGKEISIKMIARESNNAALELAEETAVVAAIFDNGFWSQGPNGKWINRPKSKVPGARQGGHYVKYNLSILGHYNRLPESPDLALQIIPQSRSPRASRGR